MRAAVFEQKIPRTGQWRIVQRVGGTRGHEEYKTLYPNQFVSVHDARMFLFEKGHLANPPVAVRPPRG